MIHWDIVLDWDGTVNHYLSSDSDSVWTDSEADDEDDSEGTEYSDLEGDSLVESLQRTLESLRKPAPYEAIKQDLSTKNWKKTEQNRGFGYSGHSNRTKRRHNKQARDKEEEDKNLRKSRVKCSIARRTQPYLP